MTQELKKRKWNSFNFEHFQQRKRKISFDVSLNILTSQEEMLASLDFDHFICLFKCLKRKKSFRICRREKWKLKFEVSISKKIDETIFNWIKGEINSKAPRKCDQTFVEFRGFSFRSRRKCRYFRRLNFLLSAVRLEKRKTSRWITIASPRGVQSNEI